jgi:hypothetical protein
MNICTRARYKKRPDHGLIRVTRFVGKKPVEYSLQLFNEGEGLIRINKNTFRTVDLAKGYASLHGYSIACWENEERDI